MSMPLAVRQMNEARVLARLLNVGPMSRADLARELDVTRSTAGSIVASLIEAGKVEEFDPKAVPGLNPGENHPIRTGRPAIQLRLIPDHALFLGAYIGARELRLCVVDFTGTVRHSFVERLPKVYPSPEDIAQRLADMVTTFVSTLPMPATVRGINVAVPGIVDFGGDILRAPSMNWRRTSFREMLQQRLTGICVHRLVNDANAFAMAEIQRLDAERSQEAVFLLLEDGVGGCVQSGGQLLEGTNGLAGEIGHMPVGDGGHCSHTGIAGAFENYVSRPAVLAHFSNLGGIGTTLGDYLDRLDAGDPLAQTVLDVWANDLSRGLAILTVLLNPERIVIGGRVAQLAKRAELQIATCLQQRLMAETPPPALLVPEAGEAGPEIGAALMLHRAHFEDFGPLGEFQSLSIG
ncbi:putative NBD/HSP70 family sugar kinase [Sagittula marina]|uniref:Putative NBD/HSP70 family sugar kinase n=1 Tax=Sagittula marina TaxID=943940 RepID=A0A7W6DVH0_9RHOB|nr:ROK family transcriptional regulator [Sagittula marina]MBB3987360.1 putative NBD/HSP70 family sugar kinase [Sagittula marina]